MEMVFARSSSLDNSAWPAKDTGKGILKKEEDSSEGEAPDSDDLLSELRNSEALDEYMALRTFIFCPSFCRTRRSIVKRPHQRSKRKKFEVEGNQRREDVRDGGPPDGPTVQRPPSLGTTWTHRRLSWGFPLQHLQPSEASSGTRTPASSEIQEQAIWHEGEFQVSARGVRPAYSHGESCHCHGTQRSEQEKRWTHTSNRHLGKSASIKC